MLEHLSSSRFKKYIANYESDDKWDFKCIHPTIILFQEKKHLFQKGFRDVYDPIEINYPKIKTYEVITEQDPDIAIAYEIKDFPTTLFIPLQSEAFKVSGFLNKEEIDNYIAKYFD